MLNGSQENALVEGDFSFTLLCLGCALWNSVPLVKYCQFGVSPVNNSDSYSDKRGKLTLLKAFTKKLQSCTQTLILGKTFIPIQIVLPVNPVRRQVNGGFLFWCIKIFCAVGALCMFSYF